MSFLRLMSEGSVYPYLLMDEADDGNGGGSGGGDDADDNDDGNGDDKDNQPTGIDKDKILNKDKGGDGDEDPDDKDKEKDQDKDKKADRPEFMKEKFWDPEKGEPRLEAMAKAYDDLEKKMGSKEKAPDEYKIELDDDAIKALFTDGDAEKDPILSWFKEYAKENNFSQDRFDGLLKGFAEKGVDFLKENTPAEIDQKEEMEKLGKNAGAIVGNQQKFLEQLYKQGHVNEGQMQEILILTETAEGIQALQALRNYYGDSQKIPTNLKPGGGIKSADELRTMMADKRYGADQEYTSEVDKEYEKKYGTGTSGESQQSSL